MYTAIADPAIKGVGKTLSTGAKVEVRPSICRTTLCIKLIDSSGEERRIAMTPEAIDALYGIRKALVPQ